MGLDSQQRRRIEQDNPDIATDRCNHVQWELNQYDVDAGIESVLDKGTVPFQRGTQEGLSCVPRIRVIRSWCNSTIDKRVLAAQTSGAVLAERGGQRMSGWILHF